MPQRKVKKSPLITVSAADNALIVSSDDNGKYHIFMTYTIENLPVFNDYMTFDITSDGLIGFSGVWFTQNSLGEYRNARGVAARRSA